MGTVPFNGFGPDSNYEDAAGIVPQPVGVGDKRYESGTVDDKGRPFVELMSDRQLLEEMVTTTRVTRDLVDAFIKDMAKNPMLGMLGGMMGKKK